MPRPRRGRHESLSSYLNRLKNWLKEGQYDDRDQEEREAAAAAKWRAENPAPLRVCQTVSRRAGHAMMCKTPERCREGCWVSAELDYRYQLRNLE